jgi:hypothetical protein
MSTQHARATRHRARDVTTATRGNRPRGPACAERLSVTPARRGPRARAAGRPAGRKAKHQTPRPDTSTLKFRITLYGFRLSHGGPGYAYGSREPEVAKVGERARGLSTRAHTCRCHTNGHGKRRGPLPPLTTLY